MDLRKMKEEYYRYFTDDESLKAVRQNGCALKDVREDCLPKLHIISIDGKEIELSEESFNSLKEQLV